MHEIEVEGFVSVSDQRVWSWIILVVEGEAPGCLLRLAGQTHGRIELCSNGKVPLERPLVIFEPHLFVVVNLVLWRELVEKRLHIHEDVEQIVLTRRHDLENKKQSQYQTSAEFRFQVRAGSASKR